MKTARLWQDLGPLAVFFAAYKFAGIFWATGLFMAATVLALGLGWLNERRFRIMPLITLVLVLFFGGLTLFFRASTFIKMKPTAIYLLFAAALGGGALFGRYYLKALLDGAFVLPDAVWRTLTWRWAGFFVALAGLNELVWRNVAEATWVNFKVFGLMPLVFGFAMLNMPLILKHAQEETPKDAPSES